MRTADHKERYSSPLTACTQHTSATANREVNMVFILALSRESVVGCDFESELDVF